MKKVVLTLFVCLSIIGLSFTSIFRCVDSEMVGKVTSEELSLFTNVEALSYSECLNSVTNNTGHCSIKVDGTGVACVEPAWYQIKDCYGEI